MCLWRHAGFIADVVRLRRPAGNGRVASDVIDTWYSGSRRRKLKNDSKTFDIDHIKWTGSVWEDAMRTQTSSPSHPVDQLAAQ